MSHLRVFFCLIRWDLAVEWRRRETTLNMCLFALLLLFIGSYSVASRTELQREFGSIFFWMVVLFAGTVGLSRAFLHERENAALTGVLVAPVDAGVLYLAKVAATWIYVMAMELLVFGAYLILFSFDRYDRLGILLAVMGAFTLAYVGAGMVLAAMTTGLRGGELILRVLLFPLMVPAVIAALEAGESIFKEPPPGESPLSPALCAVALLCFGAIYLASGFLLFPKVVEE
ncbi:MAG: heme exporter protein CcmB [Planctomycetes bacterium]|nr:heme exporter protein CcmB [Planctomycetota bacterium]